MRDLHRNDVLDALSAHVQTGRRTLACGVLRRWIKRRDITGFSRESHDQALLLAAVYRALFRCLRQDLPAGPSEPAKKRWPRQRLDQAKQVRAHRLQLAPVRRYESLQLPVATHALLAALPPAFISGLLRLAPPVVAVPSRSDAPVPVLENIVPAYLASQIIPDSRVWTRALVGSTGPRFNTTDLAEIAELCLAPICDEYRNRIVVAAPSVAVAQHLTGLGHAMAARLRQRAGVEVGL